MTRGENWIRPILAELPNMRFYAAIHGFNPYWEEVGYLDPPNEKMPSPSDTKKFWNQCQHGSWYFLPWHRAICLHSKRSFSPR